MDTLLKRQLNPFLLISTVLVLALLAGLSVVYQSQLSDLVSNRNTLQDELNQKENTIEELRANLTQLQDRTSNLNSTLAETNALIQEERRLRREKEARIQSLESRVSNLSSTVEIQNVTISNLESNLSDTRQDWKSMNNTLDDICDSAQNSNVTEQCNDWGF